MIARRSRTLAKPIPCPADEDAASNLEKLVVPNPERIVAAVRDTLGRS